MNPTHGISWEHFGHRYVFRIGCSSASSLTKPIADVQSNWPVANRSPLAVDSELAVDSPVEDDSDISLVEDDSDISPLGFDWSVEDDSPVGSR